MGMQRNKANVCGRWCLQEGGSQLTTCALMHAVSQRLAGFLRALLITLQGMRDNLLHMGCVLGCHAPCKLSSNVKGMLLQLQSQKLGNVSVKAPELLAFA